MLTRLGIFCANRLVNGIHCRLIITIIVGYNFLFCLLQFCFSLFCSNFPSQFYRLQFLNRFEKPDGSYTRMLWAILNKSWRQHPTRHQLYGHLPPITKTIQVRRTSHAGHCWRSRDELISDVLLWTPHIWPDKSRTTSLNIYSSYVRIRDVALKTYQRRWMIGRSCERGSWISVLPSRHDDDDDWIWFDLVSFRFVSYQPL